MIPVSIGRQTLSKMRYGLSRRELLAGVSATLLVVPGRSLGIAKAHSVVGPGSSPTIQAALEAGDRPHRILVRRVSESWPPALLLRQSGDS